MYADSDQSCVFYEWNEIMKNYILSIIAAAFVCALAITVTNPKTAVGQIVKLLAGILMTVTIVAPLTDISFQNVTEYFSGLSAEADSFVDEGTNLYKDNVAGIIKSQTEAYILDKAERMGLEIAVEVELDVSNNSIPRAVTVFGALSPYAKETLGDYIADTLGISKENQEWMQKDLQTN